MTALRCLPALLLLAACSPSGTVVPGATRDRVPTYIDTGMPGSDILYVESWVDGNITSSAVPAKVDSVWNALIRVQTELGLPVNFVDPRTYSTGVQAVRLRRIGDRRPSFFLDCGRGNAGEYANIYDIYLTLVTQVLPGKNGGSEVRTRMEAVAKDAAHGNTVVRCTSYRRLEKEIAQGIAARLAPPVS